MFKKLCIIVANSSASLIAKSSALLVADYSLCWLRYCSTGCLIFVDSVFVSNSHFSLMMAPILWTRSLTTFRSTGPYLSFSPGSIDCLIWSRPVGIWYLPFQILCSWSLVKSDFSDSWSWKLAFSAMDSTSWPFLTFQTDLRRYWRSLLDSWPFREMNL